MTIDLIAFFQPYALLFARFSTILTTTIGFGDQQIPVRFRLLFALSLSIVLKDYVEVLGFEGGNDTLLALLIIQEVVIGFVIGLLGRLVITVLDIVGNIISLQIGLGNAMMFNPSLNAQTPLTTTLIVISGTFIFFMMDLHHLIIKSLVDSYRSFPIHGTLENFAKMKDVSTFFVDYMNRAIVLAIQLSLPFLILGILFQFLLGLLNRLVPSLQIFFIMLPAQIFLGFLLVLIAITGILNLFAHNFSSLYSSFPGFSTQG